MNIIVEVVPEKIVQAKIKIKNYKLRQQKVQILLHIENFTFYKDNLNDIIQDDELFKKTNTVQVKKLNNKEKKKNKKEKKKKEKNKDNDKDEDLIKLITESDIELSKQISIFSIEEEKKRSENEKNKIDEKKAYESPTINKNKNDDIIMSKRKSCLITEIQFSKYIKLSSGKSLENINKRSLSYDSLDEDRKNNKNNLIIEKDEEQEEEINNDQNNKLENNIEENLNIGNNIIINNENENKNLIDNKDNQDNSKILNEKKNIEDDISSEQSDEDQKNQVISSNDKINPSKGGIDIKKIFGEKLENQKERLHLNSPFRNFKTFNIFKAIIKAGEDLKQEQFATQLISVFREIFSQNNVDCWLSSYEIISTGQDCGLVEMISNSQSLDQIKQKTGLSLKQFYLGYFGGEKKKKYQQAIKNFIRSLAGYSLVCYFLQIKDRHNGNILIDSKGHLIHIDFGFMLSNAPGKGIKFEKAPFKITDEMLELIGGINSDNFKEYRKRLFKGYFAIYDNFEKIQKLAEFMFIGQGKYFPCFIEKENALANLKERLRPRDNMSKQQKMKYIDDLLSKSIDNWTTTYYDKFQYYIQGIFY